MNATGTISRLDCPVAEKDKPEAHRGSALPIPWMRRPARLTVEEIARRALRERRRRSWRRGFYLLPPIASLICIFASPLDLTAAIFSSVLAAAVYWFGFERFNPRLVGLELIGTILCTYYAPGISMYAVLWMVAGALGGGTGAWLSRHDALEDDFFFLPLLTAIVSFVFLVWLGLGFRIGPALADAAHTLDAWNLAFEARMLELNTGLDTGWFHRLLRDHFAAVLVIAGLCMWLITFWWGGRLTRGLLGRLRTHRTALILFKLRERYILIVILGLVFVILGGFAASGQVASVGYALILIVAIAGFFAGMGVLLFFGALWRHLDAMRPIFWLLLLTLVTIVAFAPFVLLVVCTSLGLSDAWFDYRRVARLRDELER